MTRRKFSREFKLEAVKLVTERGVTVAQACRDLELAESVLRRWMREATVAPATAFPGNGQQRLELAEIAALKKEVRGVHVGRTRDERLQSLIAALYAGRLRAQVEEEYGGFTST
jgi:transposase